LDFSAGFVKALGAVEILGAVGLILLALLDIAPVLGVAGMGVAFPAAVPLALVGVPGSFRGCRDLLTAAELPEIQVRLGHAPAAFGAPAGQRGLTHNGTATGDSELNPAALPPTVVPMWVDHVHMIL
jgi:uncharacterized membrane protein